METKAQLRYLLLGAEASPVTSDTPNGSHVTACSVCCVLLPLISYLIVGVLSPRTPGRGPGLICGGPVASTEPVHVEDTHNMIVE